MKQLISIAVLAFLVTSISCKKPAGEGGNSSIKGNVWAQKWNSSYTVLSGEGPGENIDVFIIFGNETTYGDKISTLPDGTFQFDYLRPGSYQIYVYSKTSVTSTNPNGKVAKTVNVEITKKKQTVDAGKITVNI